MAEGCTAGKRAAIIAWNLTAKEQRFTPQLPDSRRFLQGTTVTGPLHPLPAQSVGLLFYE